MSYSAEVIKRFCIRLKYDAKFTTFHLLAELKEDSDPIRTYTKQTADAGALTLNDADVLAENFFCQIPRR